MNVANEVKIMKPTPRLRKLLARAKTIFEGEYPGLDVAIEYGREPVAGGYLPYFTPEHSDLSEGKFPSRVTPVPAEVDSSRIPPVLSRVRGVLELEVPPPPPSEGCELCRWLTKYFLQIS